MTQPYKDRLRQAEIEADEGANYGVKLGLAVKTAVKAGVCLDGANLAYVNLVDAIFHGVQLNDADLTCAQLNGAHGINYWIKCLQIETWPINYTSEVMQIGCQRHSFEEWRNFSDTEICAMDGQALSFWTKWRETIFKIVEMAPAKPTK